MALTEVLNQNCGKDIELAAGCNTAFT